MFEERDWYDETPALETLALVEEFQHIEPLELIDGLSEEDDEVYESRRTA